MGLGFAVLFAVSAVALFALIYWQTTEYMNRQLHSVVDDQLQSLEAVYRDEGRPGLIRAVREKLNRSAGRHNWYLAVVADGHRVIGNLEATPTATGWIEIHVPGADSDDEDDGDTGDDGGVVLGRGVRLAGDTFVFAGHDAHQVEELRELIVEGLTWSFGAALLLAILGGALIGAAGLRRVEAFNDVARRIVQGDLERRIAFNGSGDEFDSLAGYLNEMLERIQVLMESMRQVTTDIAHDLRTPIGRMRQRLESVREQATTVAEYRTAVDDAIEETDRVMETFSALLRIAEIESGRRRARFDDVDLTAAMESVVDAYAPVAEENGDRLSARIAPDVRVHGDRDLLVQAVANLVENGIRHTPTGSAIEVVLEKTPAGTVAAVADDGPGVPAAFRGKVTQRFYRLDASRTTPGSGLGLGLVAAIADLHGARLELQDNAPGLRVSLTFPAANASEQRSA